ncbi:hypothetical protein DIE21_19855 [Burkholderia sp. Bp9140]|uniref:toxin co-regulated pilus biosynthesis Q family protein n=1 Tax=Burkholderia sp. Bp9140 TaxID=2184572 RepID=UPI000F55D22B|nr:toxin co-regulated pilus biosynthesis Q family protein [Burkholderia sp. Bp9140]RQR49524.1 hypothetical protein DIE21_19855 [Burkholderia sp. Bp9140]
MSTMHPNGRRTRSGRYDRIQHRTDKPKGCRRGQLKRVRRTARHLNRRNSGTADLADHTMRSALARWAQAVGWQLVWEAPGDFGIDAEASVTGTFDDALRSVVGALAHSNAPIQAILYRGNKVLRIVSKGAG